MDAKAEKKINVKEKLDEDNLDLSMCQLKSVPVKEICDLQKARKLNLSYNNLVSLPEDFFKIQHIRQLDLSKNHLQALPKNFGALVNLKHLDLLSNDLTDLPFSFSELKSLQWLDLKNNPLNPELKKVAGDCLDEAQCKKCAINVVRYMKQRAADEDRRLNELQRLKREEELRKKIEEEEEKKRQRDLKKQEKELRRQELLKQKQQKKNESNNENENENKNDDDEKETNDGKAKSKSQQKPFILRLLNLIFLISFLLFLLFISFSVYCDKYTNYKFFDKTSTSQFARYGIQIQDNLNYVCHKYDFQFRYLINHFKKQFNL